jgi:hypothetical protein
MASTVREPRVKLHGKAYKDSLRAFTGLAERVQLVLRPDLGLESQGSEVLERLKSHLLRQARASEWPGTILLEDEALLLQYRYDETVAAILAAAADSFQEWVQPRLPEDVSLWIGERPVLFCISHEGYVELNLSTEEEQQLSARLGFAI